MNTYRKVDACTVPVRHRYNSHRQASPLCISNSHTQEHEKHLQVPHSNQLGCNKSTFSEITDDQCQESPRPSNPKAQNQTMALSGASWNQITHHFFKSLFNITFPSMSMSLKFCFSSGFRPPEKRCRVASVTIRTEIKGDLWQGMELSHVLVLKLYSGRLDSFI